jgi:hypothetical protein
LSFPGGLPATLDGSPIKLSSFPFASFTCFLGEQAKTSADDAGLVGIILVVPAMRPCGTALLIIPPAVNIRAVAESSATTNTTITSPNIVATGRGIVSSRGRGSPAGKGRGNASTTAAVAAATALPKATEIPKGAVKTVTLTAGGIIKRAVPQGRIAGTTNIIPTSPASSADVLACSPKKQVNDAKGKDDSLIGEPSKVAGSPPGKDKDVDKKDEKSPNKTATVNGSKSNAVTPTGRGRGRGRGATSPAKSISSPKQQEKDLSDSDSQAKEGPKIIRLKSNSVAEVLKSNTAASGNISPTKEDDVSSKVNSTPVVNNKRKSAPITPTTKANLESPDVGSADSRSKRARKEKKIFDL